MRAEAVTEILEAGACETSSTFGAAGTEIECLDNCQTLSRSDSITFHVLHFFGIIVVRVILVIFPPLLSSPPSAYRPINLALVLDSGPDQLERKIHSIFFG